MSYHQNDDVHVDVRRRGTLFDILMSRDAKAAGGGPQVERHGNGANRHDDGRPPARLEQDFAQPVDNLQPWLLAGLTARRPDPQISLLILRNHGP